MNIRTRKLTVAQIQERVAWLDRNVGPRLFYLHNQLGSKGWKYHSQEGIIEIEDEQWATMFLLKFGATA